MIVPMAPSNPRVLTRRAMLATVAAGVAVVVLAITETVSRARGQGSSARARGEATGMADPGGGPVGSASTVPVGGTGWTAYPGP